MTSSLFHWGYLIKTRIEEYCFIYLF
uniref:Uncharacterized protein n=1 Tax=Anguilla anguilla TaxID=7936 RepID=A0A0E9W191_ANGAN